MGAFFVKQKSHMSKATHVDRQIGRKSDQQRQGFLVIILLYHIKKQTIGITCYCEICMFSFDVFLQEGSLIMKWFSSDRKIPHWENIPCIFQILTN